MSVYAVAIICICIVLYGRYLRRRALFSQHERRAGYEMGLPDADFLRSGGADVAGTFERRSQSQ